MLDGVEEWPDTQTSQQTDVNETYFCQNITVQEGARKTFKISFPIILICLCAIFALREWKGRSEHRAFGDLQSNQIK